MTDRSFHSSWSDTQLQVLKEALQTVLSKALKGELAREIVGICGVVCDQLERPYGMLPFNFIFQISGDWTGTGIKSCYPISDNQHEGKWEGGQLKQRLDLLRYAIKRIRDIQGKRAKAAKKRASKGE